MTSPALAAQRELSVGATEPEKTTASFYAQCERRQSFRIFSRCPQLLDRRFGPYLRSSFSREAADRIRGARAFAGVVVEACKRSAEPHLQTRPAAHSPPVADRAAHSVCGALHKPVAQLAAGEASTPSCTAGCKAGAVGAKEPEKDENDFPYRNGI